MLSMLKILLKGEIGGRALNSHGNYIVDHEKSWKNHGIVFLIFYGNPLYRSFVDYERRRRNPSFLKKLWPQNAEVLFFPSLDKLDGLQIISASIQGRSYRILIVPTQPIVTSF